jgi:anti-sigma-K factor RskA
MHREKIIVLAGKYVLGHLSEQDAADVERRMQSDPEFRRIRNGAIVLRTSRV